MQSHRAIRKLKADPDVKIFYQLVIQDQFGERVVTTVSASRLDWLRSIYDATKPDYPDDITDGEYLIIREGLFYRLYLEER